MCVLLQIPNWYISVFYTTTIKESAVKSSPVSDMVHIVEIWILEFALLLAFSNGLLKRKCQVKLLNEILAIEKEAFKLKIPMSLSCYDIIQKNNKLKAGVLTFYLIALSAKFWVNWGQIAYWSALAYYVFCSLLLSTLLIFLLVLVMVQEQLFKGINLNILNLIEKRDYSNSCEELKNLLNLHSKLYQTVNRFNDSFGLSIASVCFYVVGIQTCELYLGPFVMLTMDNLDPIIFWDGIANSFWMTPLLICLFLLASNCLKTIKRAQDLNTICRNIETTRFEEIDKNLKGIVSKTFYVKLKIKLFIAFSYIK